MPEDKGGMKFASARQRRYMYAVVPDAAKKWAHGRKTRPSDWRKRKSSRTYVSAVVAAGYKDTQRRDGEGKWTDTGGGEVDSPDIKMPELDGPFNSTATDSVKQGIERVKKGFPKAPDLRKVWHNPDITALANKGNDNIILSTMWFDDERMTKWAYDFRSLLAPRFLNGSQPYTERPHALDRSAVITHEYGHVLHGDLLHNHRTVNDEVWEFVNQDVSGFEGRKYPRWKVGSELPSAYAGESPYEFVAEALTDWLYNGQNAHPNSITVAEFFDKVYG